MFSYEQLTGKFRNGKDAIIAIGYAGKGAHKNNPASEGIEFFGPIPCGRYKIVGPPFDTEKHGPCVLRLIPDEATKERITALGRDPLSFLIHGDKIGGIGTASEGCIILARAIREVVWRSNPVDPDLEVVSGNLDTERGIIV